ncbi:SPOR domain-containing protein [Flavobacterium cucumis]|uniref:Sporulation related domain-containing protein n=1 Tax=Flavobacterium cucumis TaxID=416016 RepID=A0A1M7ZU54_9FLAO|nr:SPOR domain-containing protein [Flavobacterium cucumis]SHO72415.1 Sporulation related domain-containing protein [Flavobacterium cucumis]
MQIEKHISDLLYRYQCVTVPGFGAFLTETVSAHVTGNTNSFFPPKKVVSFNANVKNNDGLLANHVALQEKMSYELAVIKIGDIVNEWTYLLQNRNRIVLKNIGEISVNSEMNWVFEPANTVNYLTDSFGLSSFVSPEITREVLKQEVEALEEKAPIIFTPERKRDYSYLKYAAAFAVMLGVGAYAYLDFQNKLVASKTLAVRKNVQEKVQQQIQQATFLISVPEQTVVLNMTTTTEEETPYHLVASAYRSEANAQKAIAELKVAGFENAKMLPMNASKLYPVVYASFKTLSEAQVERKNIQKTHNTEAWLLIE